MVRGVNMSTQDAMWCPTEQQIEQAEITRYQVWLEKEYQVPHGSYEELWQWSVDNLSLFWESIWRYFDIKAATPYSEVLSSEVSPKPSGLRGPPLTLPNSCSAFTRMSLAAQRFMGNQSCAP